MTPWEWMPGSLSAMVERALRGPLGLVQSTVKLWEMGNVGGLRESDAISTGLGGNSPSVLWLACLPACLQLPPPLPLFDWNCRASLAAFGFAADPQPDRLNSSAYGNDMV